MKNFICILTLLVVPAIASGGNIVPQLVRHWQTSKAYTIAIAQQMPDGDYSFKPHPDQMTFKEQLMHIAGMNEYFLSTIT